MKYRESAMSEPYEDKNALSQQSEAEGANLPVPFVALPPAEIQELGVYEQTYLRTCKERIRSDKAASSVVTLTLAAVGASGLLAPMALPFTAAVACLASNLIWSFAWDETQRRILSEHEDYSRNLQADFRGAQEKIYRESCTVLVCKAEGWLESGSLLDARTIAGLAACPSELFEKASVRLRITVEQARQAIAWVRSHREDTNVPKEPTKAPVTFADMELSLHNEAHHKFLLDELLTNRVGLDEDEVVFMRLPEDAQTVNLPTVPPKKTILRKTFNVLAGLLAGTPIGMWQLWVKTNPPPLPKLSEVVKVQAAPNAIADFAQTIRTFEEKTGKRLDLPAFRR